MPSGLESPSAQAASGIVTTLRDAGCVFAEDEARLLMKAARSPAELATMVDRRVSGLPLEYVIGWAEFCGLRIAVDEGTFVPRHRTEFLVREAAAHLRRGAVVVDMCCGTGAVGVALASSVGGIALHAVDIDPRAVRCARRNIAGVGGRVYHGDLFGPLPAALRGCVDLIAANAPYVPTDEIEFLPREARLYEARLALDGGGDGLDMHRRLATEAPRWLAPHGRVVVETSEGQSERTAAIFAAAGLTARASHLDELDATVVTATALA